MKILFLTQYFPPETGAPQNRLFELAIRLKEQGIQVDVLTAMPHYPQMTIQNGYRGKVWMREEMSGIKIFRSWIYVSRNRSVVSRLFNYFSFVFSSMFFGTLGTGRYDYIFCESPPLFLGISAWWLKTLKGAKLIFNVSDLWPESAEKLGLVTNRLLLRVSYSLESFLYRNAALVTGQTRGIVSDISRRFPQKNTWWLPNGVDLSYYDPARIAGNWRQQNGLEEDDMVLLYAGILGHAQGLEVVIRAACELSGEQKIKFILMGDGPEKEKLVKLAQDMNPGNVYFFDAVSKDKMPFVIKAADAAIVPLKRLDLFKGAIPSKIFENLAMKKPLLLGVEGEAKELFIDEANAGLAFTPGDPVSLAACIRIMIQSPERMKEMGNNGRNYVQKNFNRDDIARRFMEQLRNPDASF